MDYYLGSKFIMKKLKILSISLSVMILITLLSLRIMHYLSYPNKGELLPQETRTMVDMRYACLCPRWVLKRDYETVPHHQLLATAVYIEPANQNLELPIKAYEPNVAIRFQGSFYQGLGYPKDLPLEQKPPIGKVFRYTDFEILDK